jgi:cytochrome c551/c552
LSTDRVSKEEEMTTFRTAYSGVALGVLAVLVLVACGASGPAAGTPEALYVDLGCAKCHGDNREGQRSGPPLHTLADRWTEDRLIEYFNDPEAVMEDNPRLKYMAEEYPIVMPAYPETSEEDLRKLARYILTS